MSREQQAPRQPNARTARACATGPEDGSPSIVDVVGEGQRRVEVLLEARAVGGSIPQSVLSLHRVLAACSPSGYWTGTQNELATTLGCSDRTVRFAATGMKQRGVIKTTRSRGRGELTYYLMGPLTAGLTPAADFRAEAQPEAPEPSHARTHPGSPSSSPSSCPPETPPRQPGRTGPSDNVSDLVALGIEPTPEVLDALARLAPEQQQEAFHRAEIYEARTPGYVLRIVDSLETWGPMLAPAQRSMSRTPAHGAGHATTLRCWAFIRRVLLGLVALMDRRLGPEKGSGVR